MAKATVGLGKKKSPDVRQGLFLKNIKIEIFKYFFPVLLFQPVQVIDVFLYCLFTFRLLPASVTRLFKE